MSSNQFNPPQYRELVKGMITAGETGEWHVKIEQQNEPDENMQTLAPEGPYAYSLHRLDPVGGVSGRISVITTFDDIHAYYRELHTRLDIVDWHPINQIRGAWYGFQHGIGDNKVLATGRMYSIETVLLLPTFGSPGITGELFWYRYLDLANRVDPECGPVARTQTMKRHNRFLDAIRTQDIETIVSGCVENCQTAICDYVTESGTLARMDGRDAQREYYEAFFEKFHVRSVEVVQRTVEDWFVFSELLWTLEPKKGGTGLVGCSTAEFAALASDGRVLARIGHGTALESI